MKKILITVFVLTLLLTVSILKNNETKKEEVKCEEKNFHILSFYSSSFAVVSNGEVYVNVSGTLNEMDSLFGSGSYATLTNIKNQYQEYNFDGLKFITNTNENFKGIKLNVSDVKGVYEYAKGQSITSDYGIIILKNDGSLSVISLYSLINGKTNVTPISQLSNIVDVISSPKNIDSNGNFVEAQVVRGIHML